MLFNNNSENAVVWLWNYFGTNDFGEGAIRRGESVTLPFPSPADALSEPVIRLTSEAHPENAYCVIYKTRGNSTLVVEQVNGEQISRAEYGYSGLLPNLENAQCTLYADLGVRLYATYEGGSNPVAQNIFNASIALP